LVKKGQRILEGVDISITKIDQISTPQPTVSDKDAADLAQKIRYLIDLTESLRATVYVDNGLNQDVTVQVKANISESYTKSIDVGSSFAVGASSQDARTLTPDTSGWLPYVMVTVQCSVAPSSGSLTIYLVKSKNDITKLVDALEIRDTDLHTPSTDSTKILIKEW